MRVSTVLWMFAFLGLVAAAGALLFPNLQQAFLANAVFNGMILAVLLIGILINFRQVWALGPELKWLERRQQGNSDQPDPPNLLAPLARMLSEREGKLRLSALSSRSVLDGLRMRLDEHRDISRYLVGLLIFLGLLGTFWGLLDTITAVGGVISSLELGQSGLEEVFSQLKTSLQSPLTGMGTAFSSSLFGLGGSLILGFLDLQAGHAENRFFKQVEDWLAEVTHLSGSSLGEGEGSVPVYIEALLEKTADNLENMGRIMRRSEEERSSLREQLTQLNRRLAEVGNMIHDEQSATRTLTRHQQELMPLLVRMSDALEQQGEDRSSLHSELRNLNSAIPQMADRFTAAQELSMVELRQELRLMTRTLAGRAPESDKG